MAAPIFVSVCLLVMTVVNAAAQVEFHPRLTLSEEYTDNLFLSDSDENEDWITTFEPGISLTYTARSVDVSIDYSLRYLFYQDNSSSNIDEFKDVQRADARASFFAGRPFTLTFSEAITREVLDERENNADYNELENRTTVYNFTATPEYRLEISPSFSLVLGYTYDRVDYVDASGNDSEEHVGHFSAVKELSSNTTISLNYFYTAHQADTDADYDQQNYTINLQQQVGPRLHVEVEAGLSEVEYDNGRDEDDTNWLLAATYSLSEPLLLNASYNQSFATSITNGLTKSRSAVLGLGYDKNEMTALAEIYWQQADYVLSAREDESFGSRFSITVPLTRAFSTTVDADYEWASFDDVIDEDVDRFSFGVSLGYEYRRFLASLGYRYRSNDSDNNANDFTNNVFTLSASVRF